jgi:hypothetical protein
MNTRATFWLLLAIGAVGLGGYGVGSGWVRLGPPPRDAPATTVPQLEATPDLAPATQPALARAPLVDDRVLQAAQNGSGASTTPASTILEINEPAPGGTTPVFVTRDFDSAVALRSPVFWVRTDSPDETTVKIGTLAATYDAARKMMRFDLTAASPPKFGRQQVILTPTNTGAAGKLVVNVIVPQPNQLIAPTFKQYATGPFAPLQSVSDSVVNIYGTYVRVLGTEAPVNQGALEFYVYAQETSGLFARTAVLRGVDIHLASGTRTWDATLTLPTLPPSPTETQIFAVATGPSNQQFSASPFRVQRVPFTLDLNQAPTIDGVFLPPTSAGSPNGTSAYSDPVNSSLYFVNQRSLIFHGTPAVPANSQLLVFLDDERKTPIAIAVPPATSGTDWRADPSPDPPAKLPDDNTPHVARAAFVQGDQISRFSDAVTIQYSNQGPKLESIGVSSPGPDLGVQRLTVRFSGNQLKKSLAETASNYTLISMAQLKNLPTPTATYDAGTNTVNLEYAGLPADAYKLTLTLRTGVDNPPTILTDIFGNPITGNLTLSVVNAPDGGTVDGIPKPEKAPNAVFPEFNNPRPEPNGFNPSDHVDTRVARLYFYRDARRVAEVINRDLKSYNQAAVDTRRRLAEKARTEADTLTDQRRLQEIKAVRAAQATREAQKRVDQAQSAIQQNQSSASQATSALNALTARRDSLQQQLTQAQAAAAPPAQAAATGGTTGATGTPADDEAAENRAAAARMVTSLTRQLQDVQLQITQTQDQSTQANSQVGTQTSALKDAQNDLQAARTKEANESDESVKDQAQEDRARENQFRLEVAAAHEDPNSYVPGKPDSIDPVLQVSISVIGEGVLQLRGPIKGVNIIRRMINEIDTPAGQVRIALHTVQINGEHESRMEKVAGRIQAYVDHSRFLTVQSSQMLRNAVVKVASRKAEEACASLPPEKTSDPKFTTTQEFRDRKYQEAFFGVDFINELQQIDSEFLHTGNKLLSLHSMDTTSLASALFLLALAKNETRLEILQEFKMMLETDLPEAENTFELSSGRTGKEHHHKILPLAQNARFQSFMGFFNAEVAGNDTLNPLQREFIKLAQILKSRLVVEMEYNQRFRERGLIEDRLGNYLEELKEQQKRENAAKKARIDAQAKVNFERALMSQRLDRIKALLTSEKRDFQYFRRDIESTRQLIYGIINNNQTNIKATFADKYSQNPPADPQPQPGEPAPTPAAVRARASVALRSLLSFIPNPRTAAEALQEVERLKAVENIIMNVDNAWFTYNINGLDKRFYFAKDKDGTVLTGDGVTDTDLAKLTSDFYEWIDQDGRLQKLLVNLLLPTEMRPLASEAASLLSHLNEDKTLLDPTTKKPIGNNKLSRHIIFEYFKVLTLYSPVTAEVQRFIGQLERTARDVIQSVSLDQDVLDRAHKSWDTVKSNIQNYFLASYAESASTLIDDIDSRFEALDTAQVTYQNAQRAADEARRPIDAKKLLDLLIDEIEDKYIELLEGIRSHTANIDGYVKAIATALDDDFNNQFYYPAFKEIRQSSSYWDVQLAQVETTNILTNNRMFAKVEPQATMEFDLPKRDILINEAMNGAKALMDSYGALVADPSFLALTKMQSGQPTSSPAQGFGSGGNTVRNVLPGLPRSNDEQLLSQAPAGRKEFGSPLEALIPDPAIYKFETGTGFEIRPVIQPDGQSVVFHLDYMYTTNVREPVRADEKHLGRIKRHFIDTEVQLGNYELREISRYTVALKASRTSRGVPLLEDIPAVGILFRPLPSASSSLQQNVILGQSTIFPTLFDLMGLRIAPAVADLDTLRLRNWEFSVRGRARDVMNRVFDYSTSRVDEYMRVPPAERRSDLYRSQETIPDVHPNGYHGPGLNLRDSQLQEGYDPTRANPPTHYVPSGAREQPDGSAEEPGSSSPPASGADGHNLHAAPRVVVPAGDAGAARAPRPTLLPHQRETRPAAVPLSPPSYEPGVSQRTPASARPVPSSPGSGVSTTITPKPLPRAALNDRVATQAPTSRAGARSIPAPRSGAQFNAALSTPRATSRPPTDPAMVRASGGSPKPAPAKTARKSVLSRIFNSDK